MKNSLIKTVLFFLVCYSCSSSISEENIDNPTVTINENRQPTGSSANDLLSDINFKKITVEMAFVEGFEPTETAKNNFKTFLENRINKPEGIEFITNEIPSTGKTVYTLEEVVDLEKEYRTKYNTNTTIAVWVLFINGKSSNDTNSSSVLGTAYWNTSFVIYEETIHNLSDSSFDPDRSMLETSVINHEFGHILGLTNLGTSLQSDHEDQEHPKHCDEEDCLMYWAAETSQGIGNMLSGGIVPTLDAQCLADLKANGGK